MTTATLAATSQAASDRIAGLDLLRGICALAVLVYHVLAWGGWAHLYTWGTYGVYIFFVLSGASMWVAYAEKFARGYPVAKFLALRLVRLAPLYLLALGLTAGAQMVREGFTWQQAWLAFLNLAFQFGLGNPGTTSQVVGGWSLGIEFVFYLLFPVFLALLGGRWWWLVLLIAFATQHAFVGVTLSGRTLSEAFPSYTQFLSFVFYFAAGCLIGRAKLQGWLRPSWLAAPAIVASMLVIGMASGAASEASLTGVLGIALSLLAAVAVAAAASLRAGPGLHWISAKLGAASYGVYVLHPFVSGALQKRAGVGEPAALVILTAGTCIALALVLERWLEQPVQRYWKARLR